VKFSTFKHLPKGKLEIMNEEYLLGIFLPASYKGPRLRAQPWNGVQYNFFRQVPPPDAVAAIRNRMNKNENNGSPYRTSRITSKVLA